MCTHIIAVTKITLYKTQCTIPNMSNVTKATCQLTQTGYSSQGPAYEQVMVDTATDYDVINRSGPRPPTTHPVPISDQDYSTLDTDEQEHDYHVLESTNAGGPTAVGGQEAQDYEIPLRKM